jgi:hypothetical protein
VHADEQPQLDGQLAEGDVHGLVDGRPHYGPTGSGAKSAHKRERSLIGTTVKSAAVSPSLTGTQIGLFCVLEPTSRQSESAAPNGGSRVTFRDHVA